MIRLDSRSKHFAPKALALASFIISTSIILPSCQSISALGINSARQNNPVASGSLHFQITWPSFKTQALSPETQRLVIGVYQGPFKGEPQYLILAAGQDKALFEKLTVGDTQVFCLAFSADNTLINGDVESILVQANQRKPVILDLQQLPFAHINAEEAQALREWAQGLFASPAPTATPSASAPVATQTPVPTSSPRAGSATETAPISSPTPSPKPSPTPTPTRDSGSGGSRGGSSGSSGNNNSTSGELDGLITVENGAPRPETVVIQ